MWAGTRTQRAGRSLTHFSQRTALPEVRGTRAPWWRVGLFAPVVSQLAWATSLVPALRCLYGDDDDEEAAGAAAAEAVCYTGCGDAVRGGTAAARFGRRRRVGSGGGSAEAAARMMARRVVCDRAMASKALRESTRPRSRRLRVSFRSCSSCLTLERRARMSGGYSKFSWRR